MSVTASLHGNPHPTRVASRAAALGPGPGSLDQGLDTLVGFLAQGLTAAGAQAQPPCALQPPVHCLVALEVAHQTAFWARLRETLGGHAVADWPAPLPHGFHRIDLGVCLLTLCVGPVTASVAQWCAHAPHLWVGGDWTSHPTQLSHLARPLARQCALGALLTLDLPPDQQASPAWAQAGFVATALPQQRRYEPRWPVTPPHAPEVRTALVVGAGLAGAAVCASLTRRGWHVTLLDEAGGPAQGASGLPVGLLSEHLTASETTLSRLSRSGMALQWRELQRLVPQGQGWQATQVVNLRSPDGDSHTAPHHPNATPAATVRPAALVSAWLAQAQGSGRLVSRWRAHVARLAHTQGAQGVHTWHALDDQGHVLAQAAHVVLAAAFGSAPLLGQGPKNGGTSDALRPVKGQQSFGPLTGEPLAPHPVRDQGVYVPCFEDTTHPHGPRLWAMGSTYERGQNQPTVTPQGHERNAASLAATLPQAHALFERQRTQGELMGWAQVRCASPDRLPLVGAVPAEGVIRANMQLPGVPREPGLWTLCALGSRGLTLSMLGAELLAAQMCGEPWPLEKELGLALDPARFALKLARKQ